MHYMKNISCIIYYIISNVKINDVYHTRDKIQHFLKKDNK